MYSKYVSKATQFHCIQNIQSISETDTPSVSGLMLAVQTGARLVTFPIKTQQVRNIGETLCWRVTRGQRRRRREKSIVACRSIRLVHQPETLNCTHVVMVQSTLLHCSRIWPLCDFGDMYGDVCGVDDNANTGAHQSDGWPYRAHKIHF